MERAKLLRNFGNLYKFVRRYIQEKENLRALIRTTLNMPPESIPTLA
jgi:hypothetical protein